MTPASTASTTLLKQFGLTTAAEELVPRLTQAGHHDALPVLLEVLEAEAEARRCGVRRRVQYGPDREVYFEQVAVPGREAAFDFTDAYSAPRRGPPARSAGTPSVCPASAKATGCAPSGTRWSRPAAACCASRPTPWCRNCSAPNVTSTCRGSSASSTSSR